MMDSKLFHIDLKKQTKKNNASRTGKTAKEASYTLSTPALLQPAQVLFSSSVVVDVVGFLRPLRPLGQAVNQRCCFLAIEGALQAAVHRTLSERGNIRTTVSIIVVVVEVPTSKEYMQ